MPLSNAERQAAWRARRNKLAKLAESEQSELDRLRKANKELRAKVRELTTQLAELKRRKS
jgi:hypothetical protein